MSTLKQKALFTYILLQTLSALTLIASFYVQIWPFELLLSFTQPLLILLMASLVVSSLLVAVMKRYIKSRQFIFTLGIAWLACAFIALFSFTAQRPVALSLPNEPTITFATFNKFYTNHDKDRYIEYFNEANVDFLALQEMRPTDVPEVADRLGYEHSFTSRTFASSGGNAVTLLSRYAFETVEEVNLETNHPVIRAEIQTPENGRVVVYSVHIPVPATLALYNKRNIVMESLSKMIEKEELPVIMGGDFNTTVFSPALRTFSAATSEAIKPVATHKIPACSWYGYGSPLCIRIDHIFVPKNAKVVDFKISPDLGSDHRALITKIILE